MQHVNHIACANACRDERGADTKKCGPMPTIFELSPATPILTRSQNRSHTTTFLAIIGICAM